MLLGGDAGQGLEPVGEMGRAMLNGPVLHSGGNCVGAVIIQACSLIRYCAHKLALLFHILRRKIKIGVNEPVRFKDAIAFMR